MTIEQIVEIPASRRITLDVPKAVPEGKTRVIIQFPLEDTQINDTILPEANSQGNNKNLRHALRRAYGAWKDNPWGNHIEDVNTMRDEWEHRDPWNPDPVKTHQN
ncbi:MAG: hypothetical protein FWG89_05055 [Treponema sp.]|nr:hypothetical protein [Treponema sp.]